MILSFNEAKDTFKKIGKLAYSKNLLAANDGNFSCRISDKELCITASGVSKGLLSDDDFIVVDLDGNLLKGTKKPSSEIKMHLKIYKERPSVNSVIHLHPPYTLVLSLIMPPDFCYDEPIIAENIISIGKVPVVKFSLPGTDEVAENLIPYINKCEIAVLKNHGVVSWGNDPLDAYFKIESLEMYSFIYYLAISSGKNINYLSLNDVKSLYKIRKKYFPDRKYL